MASVTYGKCIMANVIMAKIFMAKILWQMKLSLVEPRMRGSTMPRYSLNIKEISHYSLDWREIKNWTLTGKFSQFLVFSNPKKL